ncbi:hypothetical protein B0H10DRAFT_2207283 [Mycena sp. CBHHK59/15]|nr:hypothetical protein B0H10DRAFT_2249829 [Mycena sp. CBHHK59/15]KAJ6631660.1 hypothetical protein B0H10DRAFT_2207283 [Mycena sp. CBHHK59/15]
MSTFLQAPEYAGIRRAIRPGAGDDWEAPFQDEVDDDVDGEKETFVWDDVPGLVEDSDEDDDNDEEDEDLNGDSKMPDMSTMRAILTEASKGVAENTDAEYKRLIAGCEKFVHAKHLIKDDESLFNPKPHPDAAWFIVAWIMDR